MEDDLEQPVCSFCGARAQSPVPQGWFCAELEHVVDEDEELAAVEVWEAVACPVCEGQIRMTAAHLEAQGGNPLRIRFDGSATLDDRVTRCRSCPLWPCRRCRVRP